MPSKDAATLPASHETPPRRGFVFSGLPGLGWLALLAMLPFLAGIGGPFLLDDLPNFERLLSWSRGELSWASALFDSPAGPTGRPLSQLSFMANIATTGLHPLPFKAVNLLVHGLNAWLLAQLLARLLARDPRLKHCAKPAAWLLALLWAVLPLHVASVLYSVQRMTLLSTSLALCSLLAWVHGRQRLEDTGQGLYWIWLATPVLAALAALAKEPGLLALPICLVLEFTLFTPARGQARPQASLWFLRLFVLWPGVFAAAWMATHPGMVLSGYEDRAFSFAERSLSQPRALWDYALNTFLPDPGRLGLYQDAFPLSTAWTSPPSTALAWIGGLLLCAIAAASVRACPGLAAGIGWFLAGHLMESSVFSLEPYFIHRNYLPSMGLLLAAASVLAWLLSLPGSATRLRATASACLLLAFAYGATTAVRAWTWGDHDRLMAHELRSNPGSLRLQSDLAAQAMMRRDLPTALARLQAAEGLAGPEDRRAVQLWRLLAYCTAFEPPPPGAMSRLDDGLALGSTAYSARAASLLAEYAEYPDYCRHLPAAEVAGSLLQWLKRSPRPRYSPWTWETRYAAARLLVVAGKRKEAQRPAIEAFYDSGRQFHIGEFAFRLAASRGDRYWCQRLYRHLKALPSASASANQRSLQAMAAELRRLGLSP